MSEYLLVLIMTYNSGTITTIKVPDKDSCYRAGVRFVQSGAKVNGAVFTCTEIKKDK